VTTLAFVLEEGVTAALHHLCAEHRKHIDAARSLASTMTERERKSP